MTFFYDLNKKLAALSAKQEISESAEPVAERATGDYSAKKARAGKDIGKPGKMFSKIAKSAGERYGSKERGEKVAGAVLAKLRAKKESVEPDGDVMDYLNDKLKDFDAQQAKTDESALQAYLGKKKYGDAGMKALQKAGREHAGKDKMAKIRAKYDKMDEEETDEGNAFTAKLKATPKGGKFELDGKTYKDTSNIEEADYVGLEEKKAKPDYLDLDKDGNKKETMKKAAKDAKRSKGTAFDPEVAKSMFANKDEHPRHDVKDTGYSKRYTRKEEPEEKEDEVKSDAPKKKGRPKGPAKGDERVTKGSHKYKMVGGKRVKKEKTEEDLDTDGVMMTRPSNMSSEAVDGVPLVDKGEYDQEGDMAKDQLHTIMRNAKQLHKLLSDDENLPEWVQSKLAKMQGMMQDVTNYMLSQHEQGDEAIAEKAVSQQQQKFMGMAHAMQKGEKIKGASPELKKVAKTMKKSDVKDFAATKHAGLPKKVKEETAEESQPEEDKPAKSKGGYQFGKGIYESMDTKFKQVLNEGMNVSVNMSTGPDGQPTKNITVSADGDDAESLAKLLTMAGLTAGKPGESECPTCSKTPCGCAEMVDENSPDWPTNTETSDDALQYSGGLNKPKSTGQTTIPVIASQLRRQVSMEESVELERSLFKLYQNYKAK
jgi:hypothetical protein